MSADFHLEGPEEKRRERRAVLATGAPVGVGKRRRQRCTWSSVSAQTQVAQVASLAVEGGGLV